MFLYGLHHTLSFVSNVASGQFQTNVNYKKEALLLSVHLSLLPVIHKNVQWGNKHNDALLISILHYP